MKQKPSCIECKHYRWPAPVSIPENGIEYSIQLGRCQAAGKLDIIPVGAARFVICGEYDQAKRTHDEASAKAREIADLFKQKVEVRSRVDSDLSKSYIVTTWEAKYQGDNIKLEYTVHPERECHFCGHKSRRPWYRTSGLFFCSDGCYISWAD